MTDPDPRCPETYGSGTTTLHDWICIVAKTYKQLMKNSDTGIVNSQNE
jgi:hypothetical protein